MWICIIVNNLLWAEFCDGTTVYCANSSFGVYTCTHAWSTLNMLCCTTYVLLLSDFLMFTRLCGTLFTQYTIRNMPQRNILSSVHFLVKFFTVTYYTHSRVECSLLLSHISIYKHWYAIGMAGRNNTQSCALQFVLFLLHVCLSIKRYSLQTKFGDTLSSSLLCTVWRCNLWIVCALMSIHWHAFLHMQSNKFWCIWIYKISKIPSQVKFQSNEEYIKIEIRNCDEDEKEINNYLRSWKNNIVAIYYWSHKLNGLDIDKNSSNLSAK